MCLYQEPYNTNTYLVCWILAYIFYKIHKPLCICCARVRQFFGASLAKLAHVTKTNAYVSSRCVTSRCVELRTWVSVRLQIRGWCVKSEHLDNSPHQWSGPSSKSKYKMCYIIIVVFPPAKMRLKEDPCDSETHPVHYLHFNAFCQTDVDAVITDNKPTSCEYKMIYLYQQHCACRRNKNSTILSRNVWPYMWFSANGKLDTLWQFRIFSYGLHGSIAGNIDITPPDVVVFNVILVSNTVHQHSAWGMDMYHVHTTWWRHQIETFSALLAFCWGNSPVTGEFPSQRPVTRSFGVYFDPRLNKRLSKLSKRLWFQTPSRPLWRHCIENSEM